MNLSLFILIPLATAIVALFSKGLRQVRVISFCGALLQLILAGKLLYRYCQERAAGNESIMLFETDHPWFAAWNIHYHIGVDGIAIAMILLTAFVMVGAVLVSWKIQ